MLESVDFMERSLEDALLHIKHLYHSKFRHFVLYQCTNPTLFRGCGLIHVPDYLEFLDNNEENSNYNSSSNPWVCKDFISMLLEIISPW